MKKAIILSLCLIFVLAGCGKKEEPIEILEPEEAKARVEKFINDELISGGEAQAKAIIKEITEEDGLYKLQVTVESQGRTQDIESYMTRDGKKFFSQGIDMNKTTEPEKEADIQRNVPEVSSKQNKPKVELFIMSHCPYGTQIEKGILPVVETLGDKIDFELKFCDYAMHGEVEINEQLNQYCIQKEEPKKLVDYLKCFLETGVSTGCLAKAKVNTAKMEACTKKADTEFKITANFEDKENWFNGKYPQFNIFKEDVEKYDIKGSPALVVNEEKITSSRDSQSLLEVVCSSFSEKPEECKKILSSVSPSPGFGYEGSGSNTEATCN